MQKNYDGDYSIKQLKQHGKVGLGTFNGLEGELVIVDGRFYQCTKGKTIQLAADDALIPWANVTCFTDAASIVSLENIININQLESKLFELTDMSQAPYVFHIRANFNNVLFRQVLKQKKPYTLSIEEVYEKSPLEDTGPITADLVGFYMPEFMQTIQPKGLHLHGISANEQSGGHVLEVDFKTATLTFEKITEVHMALS